MGINVFAGNIQYVYIFVSELARPLPVTFHRGIQ